jgi:hypothetical protein
VAPFYLYLSLAMHKNLYFFNLLFFPPASVDISVIT